MRAIGTALGAALLAAAPPPVQEPAPAPATGEDVVVNGIAKPYRLDVKTLIAARRAFDDDRSSLAPAAGLQFEVREGGGRPAPDLRLTLTDGTRTLPLPLDRDGIFALPPLPAGKWRLLANRGRRVITVRARVMSPGTAEGDRRLGDLRLQCRVMLAMVRADASVLLAPALAVLTAAGPCSSRRIGIYYATDLTIARAELREGPRSKPVSVLPSRRGYRAPLDDRSFGNDARVVLTT